MKKRTAKNIAAALTLAAVIGLGSGGVAEAQDYHHGPHGGPHVVHRGGRDYGWEHHRYDRVWLHTHRHWVYDWRVRRYVWVPYDYVIAEAPPPVVEAAPQVVYETAPPPVYMGDPVGINLGVHIR